VAPRPHHPRGPSRRRRLVRGRSCCGGTRLASGRDGRAVLQVQALLGDPIGRRCPPSTVCRQAGQINGVGRSVMAPAECRGLGGLPQRLGGLQRVHAHPMRACVCAPAGGEGIHNTQLAPMLLCSPLPSARTQQPPCEAGRQGWRASGHTHTHRSHRSHQAAGGAERDEAGPGGGRGVDASKHKRSDMPVK
jgi:hypothetical protein